MKFKIKPTEVFDLLNYIKSDSVLNKLLNLLNSDEFSDENNYSVIDFSDSELEITLDELTFLFTLKGLEKNGEPNNFGVHIESLIDIFFR